MQNAVYLCLITCITTVACSPLQDHLAYGLSDFPHKQLVGDSLPGFSELDVRIAVGLSRYWFVPGNSGLGPP